jgi:hypothetical protein
LAGIRVLGETIPPIVSGNHKGLLVDRVKKVSWQGGFLRERFQGQLQGRFFSSDHPDILRRFTEECGCELAQILVPRAQGGAGGQVEKLTRRQSTAIREAAQKEGQFCSQGAGVKVGLIHNHGLEGGTKKGSILGPTEHVLQHGVVGNHDLRRILPRFLPGSHPARIPPRYPLPVRPTRILRRFTGEMKETNLGLTPKPLLQPIHLVVHQGIHGIKEQAAHPRLLVAGTVEESVQKGKQEGLGLS